MKTLRIACFLSFAAICLFAVTGCSGARTSLQWTPLAELPSIEVGRPNPGVAGPFVGVHDGALLIAGGANFPNEPLWETAKVWHDRVYVLEKTGDGGYAWRDGGRLPRPVAYGAAVSTPQGIVCMGGNDTDRTYADCFLLTWGAGTRTTATEALPPLPETCAYGQAAMIGNRIYVCGGTEGPGLETAMDSLWVLDWSRRGRSGFAWQVLAPCPGPARGFGMVAAAEGRLYLIGGRRMQGDQVQFLDDVWEYDPATNRWRARGAAPQPMMAGEAIGVGGVIHVLGGADGSLFHRTDELRDAHPGFPRKAFAYDVAGDRWSFAGETPRNHVTTVPVLWDGAIIIASGEVRPRVRSPQVWAVRPKEGRGAFEVALSND